MQHSILSGRLFAMVMATSACATTSTRPAQSPVQGAPQTADANRPNLNQESAWTATFSADEQAALTSLLTREVWKNDRDEPVRMGTLVGNQKGAPLFIAAVYTDCIHVCPTVVADLQAVDRYFRERSRPIRVALVSLNPDTDNAERLQMFRKARSLPESWTLLRGTADQTAMLTDVLDMHMLRMDEHIFHESKVAVVGSGREAGVPKLLLRSEPNWLAQRTADVETALANP